MSMCATWWNNRYLTMGSLNCLNSTSISELCNCFSITAEGDGNQCYLCFNKPKTPNAIYKSPSWPNRTCPFQCVPGRERRGSIWTVRCCNDHMTPPKTTKLPLKNSGTGRRWNFLLSFGSRNRVGTIPATFPGGVCRRISKNHTFPAIFFSSLDVPGIGALWAGYFLGKLPFLP